MKRVLSLLLAVMLVVSLCPVQTSALSEVLSECDHISGSEVYNYTTNNDGTHHVEYQYSICCDCEGIFYDPYPGTPMGTEEDRTSYNEACAPYLTGGVCERCGWESHCEHEAVKSVVTANVGGTHTNKAVCADCGECVTTITEDCTDANEDGTCDFCGDSMLAIVYQGYCGGEGDSTNLMWSLTEDGLLTISGEGEMANFTRGTGCAPWNRTLYVKTPVKEVVVAPGVTTLGRQAFEDCESLTNVTLPESITVVGEYAFSDCANLTNVTLPESITVIGEYAFFDCEKLSAVTIPTSVTSIGTSAFGWCDALSIVHYTGTEEQWNSIVIEWGNEELTNAQLHYTYETALCNGDKTHVCGDYCEICELWIREAISSDCFDETGDDLCDLCGAKVIKVLATGYCGAEGENLIWTLTDDGALTISGSGAMAEYCYTTTNQSNNAPWDELSHKIKSVEIGSGVTSVGAYAFYGYNYEYLEKAMLSDTVTIIGRNAFCGSGLEEIHIPEGVTTIGAGAFSGTCLRSVSVPSSVTAMGNGVFFQCSVLTDVTLADGLTVLGEELFYYCRNLEEIMIPESIAVIEQRAFQATGLRSVAIPDSVTDIGYAAFSGCTSLRSVTFGENVETIGTVAFANCPYLTSVKIPAAVTKIGNECFSGCTELKMIEVDEENLAYTDVEGVLFTKDMTMLLRCPIGFEISDYIVPDGVIEICGTAFSKCTALTSILLPTTLERVEEWAFNVCDALTDVYYIGTQEQWSAIAIEERNNEKLLEAELHYVELTYHATGETVHTVTYTCTECGEIAEGTTMESCVDDNGDGICDLCGEEPVVVATGFCGAEGENLIWTLTDDGALTISGSGAMAAYSKNTAPWCEYANELKSLVIEDGVTTIGNYAFYGCDHLTGDLIFPDSVTDIGGFAFQNCTGFDGILDLGSVQTIGNYTFHSCSGLTGDLTIPETCTSVGTYCFYGCKGFNGSLTLSSKLTKIRTYSFNLCSGLTGELVLPEGITAIGAYAFYRCQNLTGDLVIPDKVTEIGNYAFRMCAGFENITIGSGVAEIGKQTFTGCSSAECVVFLGAAPTVIAASDSNCSFDADKTLSYLPGNPGWTETDAYNAAEGTWNGYILQTTASGCVDEDKDTFCDDCGKQIVFIEKFSVAGSNMDLGNALKVNFLFLKKNVTATGLTAVITQQKDDGTTVVTEYAQEDWETNGNYYLLAASVAAKEMADKLTIEIVDAEGYVYNNAYSTSVREYGAKALASSSTSDYMKILVVDMLNYGAAAQVGFGYNTEDLANNQLTEEQQALATPEVECTNYQVKSTNCYGSNLNLADRIEMNVYFSGMKNKDVASMYAIVSFNNWLGEEKNITVPGSEFISLNSSIYGVVVDDIVLADAKQLVTVTVYDADGTVHGTGSDSVESYANRGTATEKGPVYANIMKFATSAYNYLINR